MLDQFKNKFLSAGGLGGAGGQGDAGKGRPKKKGPNGGYVFGTQPDHVDFNREPPDVLRLGCGVSLFLDTVFETRVKDLDDQTVRGMSLTWSTGDRRVAQFDGDRLIACGKGKTQIWASVVESKLESPRISVEVLNVDHVLLTPREIEIPLGTRQLIQAEVTDDDGNRYTDVFLQWTHDADDPLLVLISPRGSVYGNRRGQTAIRAGVGDPLKDGVWARIPVEARVIENDRQGKSGGGFPELRITGRDKDPETGNIRPGDPDRPSLNQEVFDIDHNIWWLNLDAPEAAFFFQQGATSQIWRGFHAQKLVEMVGQVRMHEEIAIEGREERPEVWARHKAIIEDYQVELMAQMWTLLQPYILTGQGLE